MRLNYKIIWIYPIQPKLIKLNYRQVQSKMKVILIGKMILKFKCELSTNKKKNNNKLFKIKAQVKNNNK